MMSPDRRATEASSLRRGRWSVEMAVIPLDIPQATTAPNQTGLTKTPPNLTWPDPAEP